jgi:hypothetical protein
MHLGYAGVKVVLAGLSCYAVYTVAIELNASSQDVRSTALTWMLIVAAVGFVYPVVLVITMSLKPVREFLEAATVARIF